MAGTTGAPDARKSVGAKDAKKAKRFRGQDLTLPDRAKEAQAESEAERKLRIEKRERLTREVAEKSAYGLDTLERVINLRRRGMTTYQISRVRGMPTRQALYSWLEDKPEFSEQFQSAYDDFIREQVEGAIHTVNSYTEVKGLKGWNMVQAMDKQVMRKLQYAGTRLKDWKPEQEGGGDTIVIEVSGGWNPAPVTALPGSPNGQGAEAALAAERWKAIRGGATDA